MKENKELLNSFIDGSDDAFEKLVFMYRKSAEQFAKRYIQDHHTAEDIVQDAFVSSYINRKKYKASYTFKTYLYTIIRNKCVDHIRKESKTILYELKNEGDSMSAEDKLIHKETLLALKSSIDSLHKPYKTAIYLVDIDGCTYKEAAKIMDKNLASFKVTLFRARKKIREDFLEEVADEGR